MFGSQILDVAIGLIFIFLMLSLVVMAVAELIASWLKLRSKTLWAGIVRMLGDEEFARRVYAHPLISSLSQSAFAKPSYIPSRTFALALLDTLTPAGEPPPGSAAAAAAAVAGLPRGHLSTALTVLMKDTPDDLNDVKKGIEQWFDTSMDRASGWYKRRTQWILLIVAATVTIWCNADTIVIANTLWRDPAVRSALVAQARQYVDRQRQDTASAAAGPSNEGPTPPPPDPPSEAAEIEETSAKLDRSMADLRGLNIPLGWGDPAGKPGWSALAAHGLGWLLTALALSLGAPFWFDTLAKVVSIRGAGKPPGKKAKPPN